MSIQFACSEFFTLYISLSSPLLSHCVKSLMVCFRYIAYTAQCICNFFMDFLKVINRYIKMIRMLMSSPVALI